MKKLILVLLCLVLAFALVACKGDPGDKGDPGEKGEQGAAGKSSYEIAVEHGFTGTEADWLASLKGLTGDKGMDGVGIKSISIDHQGYVYVELSNGEKFTVMVEDYCYHENSTKVVTSPTCAERGYTTNICNDCGFVLVNGYTEKIGHHFVDKKCNICGEEEPFGYITVNLDWYTSTNATFTISNREQLAGLSYLVSNGTNFSGKTITLGCDIDLGNEEWIPIGTASTPFAGTFDGHEYTIYNLKVSEQESYAGLFGNVSGTIKRLSVINANVTSDGANSYVGIVCGYCSGSLDQVNAGGYVTAPDSLYVGGVAGQLSFSGNKTYTALTSSAEVIGREHVGGVAGRVYAHFNKDNYCYLTLDSIENSGNVSGTNYVGGIYGTIDLDNSNSGDIVAFTATGHSNTGNVTGEERVGGIVGHAATDTTNLLTDSTSSATIIGDCYVGGLIGCGDDTSIKNCDNTGSVVKANKYTTVSGAYYVYLGGYVGYGYEVIGCTNSSDIVYESKGDYVGGIAGYLSYRASECSNTGNITAEDSNYIGGLVGKVSFSGNNTITSCTNSGKIVGNDYVGGLFGNLCGCYNIDATHTLNLSLSENSGEIVGQNLVGGIAGQLCLDNTNSYDDIKMIATDLANTGNISGAEYVGGLFGKAYSDSVSTISDSTSSAAITGDVYVGGLAGYLGKTSINSCDNTGTTVTANDYFTSGGLYYVYLGGYVGYGYEINGCTNSSDITYTKKGDYVGGLAGYLSYRADTCANSGNITASYANYVGGLVGKIGFSGNNTITSCTNSGKIVGNDCVGGLFGNLCGCYDIDATHTLNLSLSENSGEVVGKNYVGGISGKLCLNNTNSYDNIKLTANDLTNRGNVTGTGYVGGLFGYASADNGGTIVDYSNTGVVTGSENYGDIIGSNVNITI